MLEMRICFLEGRKREERVGELGNVACCKMGTHHLEGRSRLVSLETWHVTNEDSQTGGEEEEDQVSELGNVACHKRGLTFWRGGRERSRLMSLETQSITK